MDEKRTDLHIDDGEKRLRELKQRLRELNEESLRIVEEIDMLSGETINAVCVLSET